MHDQVRVAADGRGEVGVAVGREAEVAERLRRVARLLHGAQQDRVDEPLLGASLRLLEHGGERPGRRTPLLHPQTQPEALEEARQLAHALRGRRLVHAVEEAERPARELARHRLVGGEHELLDHLVRDRALGAHDLCGSAAEVEHHLGFGEVEVDGAPLPAAGHEQARQRLGALERLDQGAEGGAHPRIAVDQRLADLGVGQARGASHDGVVEGDRRLPPARIEFQADGLHQAVLVGLQAADAVRQLLGEHGEDAVGEVDARAARAGFQVERAPGGHVVRHVGHRDRQAEARAERLDQHGVVEVARVLAVDGDDREAAEVEAAGGGRGRHARRHAARGGGHLGREVAGQVVGGDHRLGLDPGVGGGTQDGGDARLGLGGEAGPADQVRNHHVAVGGAAVRAARHDDGHGDALLLRDDHGGGPTPPQHADHPARAALEHPGDAPLGAPAALEALDAHQHPVAVHRGTDARGRHVDVLLLRVVGHAEGVARGVRLETAGHEIEPGGQGEAISLGAHQGAAGLERREPLLARPAFVGAREPGCAQEVLGGDRALAALGGRQEPRLEGGILLARRCGSDLRAGQGCWVRGLTRRTRRPRPRTSTAPPGPRWRTG